MVQLPFKCHALGQAQGSRDRSKGFGVLDRFGVGLSCLGQVPQ